MLHLGGQMLHLGNAETLDSIDLLQRCTWERRFRRGRGGIVRPQFFMRYAHSIWTSRHLPASSRIYHSFFGHHFTEAEGLLLFKVFPVSIYCVRARLIRSRFVAVNRASSWLIAAH